MKGYITIRVPQAMKEQLEEMADRERRSVSQVALMALERGMPSFEGVEPRRAENPATRVPGERVDSAEMPTAPKPKKSKWANKYCPGHHVMGCEVCE